MQHPDLDAGTVARRTTIDAFFGAVLAAFPAKPGIASVIVTHIRPDAPAMLQALGRASQLGVVLAKPQSIDQVTRDRLPPHIELQVAHARFSNVDAPLAHLTRYCSGRPAIILDVGGYFAGIADELNARYGPGLLGIVEDTENGHQKYERASIQACPVISVARSPLKDPEDWLVGQSIVFSAEALLRERADVLHGRTACVIGYGKIGRSITNTLHARRVRAVVYDLDAVKRVEAMSRGFGTAATLEEAVAGAALVFCATGNKALQLQQFAQLDRGAYVATVTSGDDELEMRDLHQHYDPAQVSPHITCYSRGDHYFYLMNGGHAVNFVHGSALGPFICLIQAELLASVARLSHGVSSLGITENDSSLRAQIAHIWLEHFGSDEEGASQ
ncbi:MULTISPECIES: NAD(P)-dependent oxidoreductase [Rhodomicrobium]|uniref:NAD(P)-dependent oxidoreductase n=1 Tax=Rhodomicrobium TaxID=1068 RepID=UPI000B4BA8A5|nr:MULTISPECIES: NAD(P)-dependent oxidoreductase [Rhodomicrobium]